MTTWTLTGTQDLTYTGAPGVDVIAFTSPDNGAAYIDASSIAKLTISGRGTFQTLSLQGSSGYDALYINSNGLAKVDFSLMTFGSGWTSSDRLVFLGTTAGETIIGSSRDDTIGGRGGTDSLRGGAGYDTLSLSDFNDTNGYRITDGNRLTDGTSNTVTFSEFEAFSLQLGSGQDSITGLVGGDLLYGGGGNDTFHGVVGDDLLKGDAGNDFLTGGSGNDRLYGGDAADILDGGSGNDRLYGDSGADQLYGGSGNDTYYLSSSQDRVFEFEGFNSRDEVVSTTSFDLAKNANGFDAGEVEILRLEGGDLDGYGNAFANTILGTTGANILRGRGGADDLDLRADAKADTIQFRSAAESTGAGFDTVRNFDANGEDRIDVKIGDVSGISGGVGIRTGGSLSAATFDADVAAKLNKSFDAGGGVQAMLWDPDGGDFNTPGAQFLVIDVNDSGSYEAGQDLVVRLIGLTGALDATDFL